MVVRALLLGGIGSGKSTAARWFEERGVVVIAADDVARSVLDPGSPAAEAVHQRWPAATRSDGSIDRAALGRIVFADPSELSALETLVHPATRAAIRDEVDRHPDEIVMVEMAVLRDWFDPAWLKVVIDAPDRTRVLRAAGRDEVMREEDVRRVMERQPSRAEWLAVADFVIDNSGDLAQLGEECSRVWEELVRL